MSIPLSPSKQKIFAFLFYLAYLLKIFHCAGVKWDAA